MVLVSVCGMWADPCKFAGSILQNLKTTIEDSSDLYNFWIVELLADDAVPMGDGANIADAQNWAADYDIEFPILTGDFAKNLSSGSNAYPTYFILDSKFKIVKIIEGYPGETILKNEIQTAWNNYIAANPE